MVKFTSRKTYGGTKMESFSEIKTVCGFYISRTHLVTMILPYLKDKLNKDIKFNTILEYSLTENINEVLSKLIINDKEKEKILELNWKEDKIQKYPNIEKDIKYDLENNKEIILLISGSREYISKANKIIDKILEKNNNKLKNKKVTIINCYEVIEFDDNIREILDLHEFIINTSGIHRVEEIFEDYQKKLAN